MIFAYDRGRMCNNLLQFGHVYSWAKEHGRSVVSMRFAYKYPYFRIGHTRNHNFLMYLVGKLGMLTRLMPVVRFDEPDADYSANMAFMESHKTCVVEGWFVRFYDLFLRHKEEIKQLFAFIPEVEESVARQLEASPGCNLRLGLHIRRGDYATWNGGAYMFSDEQYINLVRQFMALHPESNVDVFICGNDPHLNRAAFTEALGSVTFPNGNPGEDLCLLSHMDYLIGAPSTFTLVASMYRDLPLYWIHDAAKPLSEQSFSTFNDLFRHIL